ncbi:MAG: hypothetical protein ACP5N3_02110 [Candidatus Nanoarchaeia archaeon]
MGFLEYMKHRLLGLILAVLAVIIFFAVFPLTFGSAFWGWIVIIVVVILGIASAYFFKTVHE